VRLRFAVVLALVAGMPATAAAQDSAKPPRQLATAGLAGQSIALLPITLALADSTVRHDSIVTSLGDRTHVLHWADSIIGEGFLGSAPEVTWILPPRLRQLARRNPGMIPEPDQMGQAILRSPKIGKIPDPLQSSLRSLVNVTGGRYAMVPAALALSRDSTGSLRADLALALADARGGTVVWRSNGVGRGGTPGEAVAAAVASVLPSSAVGP
jgi:hypothetical protein